MTQHSILVVDDSPTDRHFLSELLLSQGYQVTAVDMLFQIPVPDQFTPRSFQSMCHP